MKLGTRGRYAVMAVCDLAAAARTGPVALAEIAARQEISLSYLEQLFARLRRAGIVVSRRGPGGGYRLARPAAATTIAEIVSAVDEPLHATRCRPGAAQGCRGDGARCNTHDLWAALGAAIRHYLDSVTVADVIDGRIAVPAPASGPGAGGAGRAAAAD